MGRRHVRVGRPIWRPPRRPATSVYRSHLRRQDRHSGAPERTVVDNSPTLCTIVNVRVQQPFTTVTPSVDGAVLLILARADATFSVSEIHQLIGDYSEAGVRKAVYRLVDQGIVTEHRVGRAHVYELNRSHVVADAVVAIARAWETLLERLRDRLGAFDHPPVYAAVFGSAARQEMRSDSDIDIFLVRPRRTGAENEAWKTDIAKLSADASAWTGNDVRVLEFGEDEIDGRAADVDTVLSEIARDGITVYGPTNFLRDRGVN